MIQEGQIVLFSFPQTDLQVAKLRPALVLRRLPGQYDDWLVCMISTQLYQEIPEVDEIVNQSDQDFPETGLKESSVIRVTRLAVVAAGILHGSIGHLDEKRFSGIRTRLSNWILGTAGSILPSP